MEVVLSAGSSEVIPANVLDHDERHDERVVKAVEYVERDHQTTAPTTLYRRYYVVYSTDMGNSFVTEKLVDGTVTWEENPNNLYDRNSLAKVYRSTECTSLTVREV